MKIYTSRAAQNKHRWNTLKSWVKTCHVFSAKSTQCLQQAYACRKNRAFWFPPVVGNTCLEMEFKPVIYNHKKIKHKINTR